MTDHAIDAGNQNLDPYWMPFTHNRYFKAKRPHNRMIATAEGAYYTTVDGQKLFDGLSGLWCCGLGHRHPHIVDAVKRQLDTVDYVPAFQIAAPDTFRLAERIAGLAPPGLNRVFFTNSGSESVETALKMAIAYHRAKGNASKVRLIGRERGYHGVNFGGTSVGGIANNRKMFGALLAGVDHLRHTHDLARNAFSRGQPAHGAELADDLERLVALHDASTIAACIVEPVACSTGVLIPPKGYLERLAAICAKHDILLIFDEVITAFGRLGAPFGADYFKIAPDIITTAKGITNGTVPMGAVFVSSKVHDAFMNGPEDVIDFFHGYTYSGHPIAAAAAVATLDVYQEEGLLTRAMELAPYWEERLHALKGLPHIIDLRNIGLIGAIEVEPLPGQPGKRAYDLFVKAFENNALIRQTGDIIALSPPLIVSKDQIDQLFDTLTGVFKTAA